MTRFILFPVLIPFIFSNFIWGSQSPENVEFDTDFESGFAGEFHFDDIGDTWILDLGADNGNPSLSASYRRTFFFRATQTAGIHLKIQIENTYWDCGNVPIASYDAETWFRLNPSVNSDTRIDLEVPVDSDQVFFSYTFPYTVSDKNRFLEGHENDPRVEINIIGQSEEITGIPEWARSIEMLTIQGQEGIPEKTPVWIHARIHPGEVPPSFMIEGFVGYLLQSNSLEAQWLLNHCVFYVVPMVNPSGVYLGNYRTNANSENLEAVWCHSPELGDQNPFPEVNAIKEILDFINNGPNPVSIALNLHATMTQSDEGHFHFKHISPSVSSEFESIENRWIQRFDETATQFNDVNPRESQLSSCAFVESYLWNHFQEQTMALTFEGVYMNRDSDDGIATSLDFRQLGAEMARTVYYFFEPSIIRFSPERKANETLILTGGKYPAQVSISTPGTNIEKTLNPYSRISLNLDLDQSETLLIQSDYQIHAYLTQGKQADALSILLGKQPLQKDAILPHIPKDDWTATLVATNHSEHHATFKIYPDGIPDGVLDTEFEFQVAPGASHRLSPSEFGESWLSLSSDKTVWTYQMLFARAGRVTASLNLKNQQLTTVYFPHLPSDRTNFWFGFVLVNTSQENQNYRMEAFDQNGLQVASREAYLEPTQRKVGLLSDEWPDLPLSASWIRIISQAPLQGLMLFGTQNGQSLAGLHLSGESHVHFHFPVLIGTDNDWQGIALLNTGQTECSLLLSIYSTAGDYLSNLKLTLGAGSRLVSTLSDLVTQDATHLSSIRIDSSQPIVALELLGTKTFDKLDGFLLEPLENNARSVRKRNLIISENEAELK